MMGLLLTGLRKVQRALHKYAEAIRRDEHGNGYQESQRMGPPQPLDVHAIISYDQQTKADETARDERSHTTQESIKKATWAAFGAASLYAFISLFMWSQMKHQTEIANKTLRQSTEAFRVDERAWIEIDSIKLKSITPATLKPRMGASFLYELYFKNVGKTVARDIELRKVFSLDGNRGVANARGIQMAQDNLLTNQPSQPSEVPALPMPKSLAPNTPIQFPIKIGGEAPQNDYLLSYSIGRVDYTDAFGVAHWLKFCFVIIDSSGDIQYCETGNDEDKNSEFPPK